MDHGHMRLAGHMPSIIVMLLLVIPSAYAATSQVSPGHSITAALRQLGPGDTLEIHAGTYPEAIDLGAIPSGTSWGAPVTLKGVGMPVLKPHGGGSQGDVVAIGQGQRYIILDGLVLDASHVSVMALRLRDNAQSIRVQHSVLRHAPNNNCMNLNDPETQSIEILNNDIYGCGADNQHHGIYVRGANSRIEGNRIYRNSGHGVHLFSKKSAVHGVIVKGNEIYDNGSWGILLGSGQGNLAVNNLVHHNGRAMAVGGIRIGYWGAWQNQVLNNTVYANAGDCVMVNDDAADSTVLNTICWQNARDQVWVTAGNGQVGYTLTQNPRFVDAAANDLRLLSDSPAIDTARPLSQVADDFARVPRPQQAGYEYGAYEFGSPRGPVGVPGGGPVVTFGPLPPPVIRLVR